MDAEQGEPIGDVPEGGGEGSAREEGGRKRKAPRDWGEFETQSYSCGQTTINKAAKKGGKKKPSPASSSAVKPAKEEKPAAPVVEVVPPAPKPTKQNAAKSLALDEAEEDMIREAISSQEEKRPRKFLREGPEGVKDMQDALRRSMQETTSIMLDWSAPASQLIGHRCKVYWDGEQAWFDARILNFDCQYNRYYIYYPTDSTAEWISFRKESVLVANRLALASRSGIPVAPVLCYIPTESAQETCKTMTGYLASGVYVEIFGQNTFSFVAEDSLDPIQDEFLPAKQTKKFQSAMNAAREEMDEIEEVVESLMKAIKSMGIKKLTDDQWIGARVRAATHRVYSKAERQRFIGDPPTAFCAGTVLHFFPLIKKHFVFFGSELQPLWVHCRGNEVELLLEKTRSASIASIPLEKAQNGSRDDPSQSELQSRVDGEGNCSLCRISCARDENLLRCSQCESEFHEHCLPDRKLKWRPLNPAQAPQKVINSHWKCFHCTQCESCGQSSWEAQLMFWNVQRADPGAKEKWMLLCGLCLKRYKHLREFCTICYRLYANEENNDADASPSVLEDATANQVFSASQHPSTTANVGPIHSHVNGEQALPPPEPSEVLVESLPTEINDKCMIQCNECCRWIHAECEGLDHAQYASIASRSHPIWGDEYLCPLCRVQLCRHVLQQLRHHDSLQMFAEPVTVEVAKNYYDVIRSPMDLRTMREKCDHGQYKALQALRQDFELMCMNALLFNQLGDEYWLFAMKFFETGSNLFERNRRKTKPTAFGAEAVSLVQKYMEKVVAAPQPTGTKKKPGKRSLASMEGTAVDTSSSSGPGIETASNLAEAGLSSSNAGSSEMMLNTDAATTTLPSLDAASSSQEAETAWLEGEDTLELVIPKSLAPLAEPASYIQPTVHVLNSEEAYFQLHVDECFICGSCGDSDRMLFCVDCGEAMHDFCSKAPSEVLKRFLAGQETQYNWRCMNCKLCAVCENMDASDVDNVVFCEVCDGAFHTHCLQPPLATTSLEGNWYCPNCVDCERCAKSSPSATAKPVSAWGYDRSCCIECAQQELVPVESFIGCPECGLECDLNAPHFACTTCGCAMHVSCCDSYPFEGLYRSGIPLRNQCRCCARKELGESQSSSQHSAGSASATDRVKWRKMMEKSQRLKCMLELNQMQQTVVSAKTAIIEHCDSYSYYALTMIVWATVRVMILDCAPPRIAEQLKYRMIYARVADDSPYIIPPRTPAWQNNRARKFLNYFRRNVKLSSESPMSSGQLSGLQLMDMNPSALSTLAVLAASFTAVSDTQHLHALRSFVETVVVVIEVVLIVTRHSNPHALISMSLLEFLFNFFCSSQSITLARPIGRVVKTDSSPPAAGDPVAGEEASAPATNSVKRETPVKRESTKQESTKQVAYKFSEHEFNMVFEFVEDFLRQLGGLVEEEFATVTEFLQSIVQKSFTSKVVPLGGSSSTGSSLPHLSSVAPSPNGVPVPQASQNIPCQLVYLSRLKLWRGMQAARSALLHPPISINIPNSLPTPQLQQAENPMASVSDPFPGPVAIPVPDSPPPPPRLEKPWGSRPLLHSQHHELPPSPLPAPSDASEGQRHPSAQKTRMAKQATKKSAKAAASEGALPSVGDFGADFREDRELLIKVLSTGYGTAASAQQVADLISLANKQAMEVITDLRNKAHCEGSDSDAPAGTDEGDANSARLLAADAVPAEEPTSNMQLVPGEPSTDAASFVENEEQIMQEDPLAADRSDVVSRRNDDGLAPLSAAEPETEPMALCEESRQAEKRSVIAAMHGWPIFQPGSLQWCETRLCALCRGADEDRVHGRLLPFSDGALVHVNCLLWCREIQVDNHIVKSAMDARDRCLETICHYCHLKGASVRCIHNGRRMCRRSYHLSCAMAAHCALIQIPDTENRKSARYSFCPLHAMEVTVLPNASSLQLWTPGEQLSCLLFEDNVLSTDSEDLAELIAQRSCDKALRLGALVVLNLGTVDASVEGLFTPQHIYPMHYRAARIFWSMKTPATRTVYLMEILYEADLGSYDLAQLEAVQDGVYATHSAMASATDEHLDGACPDPVLGNPELWLHGPLFRAVAMDDLQQPIFAKSPEVLYQFIVQAVLRNYRSHGWEGFKTRSSRSPAFGLSSHQFLGLSVPIVRRCIEMLPNSFDCMAYNPRGDRPPPEVYCPSFVLPTPMQLEAMKRQRAAMQLARTNKSQTGSCRADPFVSNVGERPPARKLFAKSAEPENGGEAASAAAAAEADDVEFDMDVELENSRAQEESRRQRYVAMSKAYVANSKARLEVRKSHIHNWGLFARIGFEKDDVIVEYIGEKIRTVVADKREAEYENQGVGSCYLFRLDKEEIIDATTVGGMARFMNHCCEPNAYARVITCTEGGRTTKHIVIIAGRDIREGEEITYDYKFPIEEKKLACYCGASRCSGAMN